MDDEPVVTEEPRDHISEWVDELMDEIYESLANHAEFERLYPAPKD